MMNCEIIFNPSNKIITEFGLTESYFGQVKSLNLLQSFCYGVSMCRISGQRARYALIRIDGEDAGFFQVLEMGVLKNLLHTVILDRGPVWFNGYGSFEHFTAFTQALRALYPRRFGRKIRFMPEVEASEEVHRYLSSQGFRRVGTKGYQTAWLDLDLPIEELEKGFKKKWRGALKKAQGFDLEVRWDDQGLDLNWLLERYAYDKAAKCYDGASVESLIEMAKVFKIQKHMLIGSVRYKGEPIAGVLFFLHTPSATYQIGWSGDLGRQKNAHHLLLWSALDELKKRNIQSLDLGGMNDETAKGVKKFKEGLGGKSITLAGIYN